MMDQQKIIHLAGEALVIGGVFIFLNKQIKTLRSEIEEIKTVMMKQQDFMESNFRGMSKAIDFLMSKNKTQQSSSRMRPKFNITPLPDTDEEEKDIIVQSNAEENTNTVNSIPTLGINQMHVFMAVHENVGRNVVDMRDNMFSGQEQPEVQIVDETNLNGQILSLEDTSDISEELELLNKDDEGEHIIVEDEEPPVRESSIVVEPKQILVPISVKERKKKEKKVKN